MPRKVGIHNGPISWSSVLGRITPRLRAVLAAVHASRLKAHDPDTEGGKSVTKQEMKDIIRAAFNEIIDQITEEAMGEQETDRKRRASRRDSNAEEGSQ